jgi:serine/threonine-protein kinase
MDVRTWTTLSRLLDEALDLDPTDREAWLAHLAADYEAFKPRLRAMLDQLSTPGADDLLRTLPRFGLAEGDRAADDEADGVGPGAPVGPFRLVRQIAAGGQGTVWLAERADGLVNRPVAVKLPHGVAYRPGLAERLAREREILASLTHPNIARLYDAGVTSSGVPFLAMEYVEGTPIDRYCAERSLDVRSRVRLFLQVVRAVAYAHGQLIIHRDLKPSNVLVTVEGQVRLLDFGIARMLDDGAGVDSTVTELAGPAMTLAYASPEQLSHAPLGVATDVYSLGVMLCEVLAGTRPYAPARDTPAALEEAILTGMPRRPSEAASTAEVRRALAGDLDTIVLHALHKVPAERYQTAAAFGEDLQRYLDGRPVHAQPDSRWYRTRRFVKRNRLAVGSAAAVLVAILAGAAVAVWQAGVARAEQRRAEDVKTFIVSLLQDANLDAADARQASVADLLRKAESRLEELPSGAVKAELLVVLGEALNGLGDTDTLERVAAQAVAEAGAASDPVLQYRARTLMAWAHMYRGRPEAMLAELDAISPVLERNPDRYARQLSGVWRLRAHQAIDAGRYEDAVQAASRALSHIERAEGGDTPPTLTALMTLAEAYAHVGNRSEALVAAERALRVAERIYADNEAHPYLISVRTKYASALGEAGSLGEAAGQLERIVADASQVFGADGRTVAFHLQRLANVQIRIGRIDAGRESVRRGMAIIERHVEDGSPTLASFRYTAAHAELAGGDAERALPYLAQALEAAQRVFGAGHTNTLNIRASRAHALALTGRVNEAWQEITGVLAAMEKGNRELERPLYVAGLVERRRGSRESAAAYLARAERAAEADLSLLWQIVAQQGLLLMDAGRPDEARAPLDRAAAIVREIGVADHSGTAELVEARRRVEE